MILIYMMEKNDIKIGDVLPLVAYIYSEIKVNLEALT